MDHILSLSYGKDSLACLGAIEKLGWPLDRIVHAEVWATDSIPADLPPMVEFKAYMDRVIKRRWDITVEHVRADYSYEDVFYRRFDTGKRAGTVYGWPYLKGPWCNSRLKGATLDKIDGSAVKYWGIAADEPERIEKHKDKPNIKLPLVEAGWTEAMCRQWCEDNGLLSPIYTTAARGGCWFCHNQGVDQLRLLRRNYPEYWALMLKWDTDSPVTFHPGHRENVSKEIINADGKHEIVMESGEYIPGHTVHDFDRRFALEDEGLIYPDEYFRWDMLESECLNYRFF